VKKLKSNIKINHKINLIFILVAFIYVFFISSNALINIQPETIKYLKENKTEYRDSTVNKSSFMKDLYKEDGLYYIKENLEYFKSVSVSEQSKIDKGYFYETEIFFNGNNYNLNRIKNNEIEYTYIIYNKKKLFYHGDNLGKEDALNNNKEAEIKTKELDKKEMFSMELNPNNMNNLKINIYEGESVSFLLQDLKEIYSKTYNYFFSSLSSLLGLFLFLITSLTIWNRNLYRGEYLPILSKIKTENREALEYFIFLKDFLSYPFLLSKKKGKEKKDFSSFLKKEALSFSEKDEIKKVKLENKESERIEIENN